MRISLFCAAHRPAELPGNDLLQPIHVGAWNDPAPWYTASGKPWLRDDAGDSISGKNETYCELTALYWLWKHDDADAHGLCHYRRFFAARRFGTPANRLLTHAEAEKLLDRCDLILPKKRRYWIETNASQYAHAHHSTDLEVLRGVLAAMEDQRYLAAYDAVMRKRSGHRFNMLLGRREVVSAYCSWLFPVLFRVESQLDVSTYSPRDRRVFGYLAERLLDVWLAVHPHRVIELPVLYTESQHWPRKLAAFLYRRIFGHPMTDS